MRLQLVPPHARWAVTGRCVDCGGRYALETMFADLDGKAFEDYYCARCAAKPAYRERTKP